LVAGRALLEAIAAATTEPSATFAYVEVGAVLGVTENTGEGVAVEVTT